MKIPHRFRPVVLVPVLAAAYYLASSDQRSRLDHAQARQSSLQAELATARSAASEYDALQKKYAAEQERLIKYSGVLPVAADTNSLLSQLKDAASDSQVQLSFEFGKEEVQPLYVKVPMKVAFAGSYKAIVEFLSRIERMDRFAVVEDIQIKSSKDGKSQASCMLFAFRAKTKDESERNVPRR